MRNIFSAQIHPSFRLAFDAGWALGFALLTLQLITVAVPEGEVRDWIYFLLAGGMAGAWLLAARFSKLPHSSLNRTLQLCKLLFCLWAFLILSYYFFLPLFSPVFFWAWPLILLVGWGAGRSDRLNIPLSLLAGWGFGCVFLIFQTLLAPATELSFPLTYPAILLSIPILLSLWVVVFRLIDDGRHLPHRLENFARFIGHMVALYLLIVVAFDTSKIGEDVAIHHWKAFLESAELVRAGGWLLWDVPAQYGFLSTLTIAWLPTKTTWQAFYLLNGSTILLGCFAVYYAIFHYFRGIAGFILALTLAIACALCLLPATSHAVSFPSGSYMRFIWVYILVGYIFFLYHHLRRRGALPRVWFWLGHGLWILGSLWAIDSAFYVSILWLPVLALMHYYPGLHDNSRRIARVWVEALGSAAVVLIAIVTIYFVYLGHGPDISMFTGYAKAYLSFKTLPIDHLGVLPGWLLLFFLGIAVLHSYVTSGAPLHGATLAALYTGAVSIWAVACYYIPFSESFHLTGTVSLIVMVTSLMLGVLDHTSLPASLKQAYGKTVLCLYAVILIGTLGHLKERNYASLNLRQPMAENITLYLPKPDHRLIKLMVAAGIWPNKNPDVQIIYRYGNLDRYYFGDFNIKPWLMPNSMVSFGIGLSEEQFRTIAARRIVNAPNTVWLIEDTTLPLKDLPWMQTLIFQHYRQTFWVRDDTWRVRKFQKKSAPK